MSVVAKTRAIGELTRFANVFTAISNVWMGMVVTTGTLPGWKAVGITATSSLLYLAGMVLNDVFDYRKDAHQRPERPIPSGRVSLSFARALGWTLLAAGVLCGWMTALAAPTAAPGWMATILAGLVLAYDGGLKTTALGPVLMAGCRLANVLLGFSLAGFSSESGLPAFDASLTPAVGIALYIWGVTWFARSEAEESRRSLLAMSAAGSMLGLTLLAVMPVIDTTGAMQLKIDPPGWYILWVVVAGSILRRMVVAILQPQPKYVQRAVGHAILSLIVIDASICLGYGGPFWGLAVLALLAPATLLAQWLKVT